MDFLSGNAYLNVVIIIAIIAVLYIIVICIVRSNGG